MSKTEKGWREVERARGTVYGFEGRDIFILWAESVRIDANGVRCYYI